MKNVSQMMQQAQKMQAKMEGLQANLDAAEIIGVSGGGMVKVILTGKGMAKRVKIDPSLVIPGDVEILEDLITAAVNDARSRVEEKMKEEMSKITGGLELPPGMNLPF
jgi:DNA-binding YbaB/EbfC family protein